MIRSALHTPAKRFAPGSKDDSSRVSNACERHHKINVKVILDDAIGRIPLTRARPSMFSEIYDLIGQMKPITSYFNESVSYISDESHASFHVLGQKLISIVDGVDQSKVPSQDAILIVCSVISALAAENHGVAFLALPRVLRTRTPTASPLAIKRKQSEPVSGSKGLPPYSSTTRPIDCIDKTNVKPELTSVRSPLLVWLRKYLGDCGCGDLSNRHHSCQNFGLATCLTSSPATEACWEAICNLCSALSDSLIAHILLVGRLTDPRVTACLLEPSSSAAKEPYACFLETFAMPVLCYKPMIELRQRDVNFTALDRALGVLTRHLGYDLIRDPSRPIVNELAGQALTKCPYLHSVYVLVNLQTDFAMHDMVSRSARSELALTNFLQLHVLCGMDAKPFDQFWWTIPQFKVSELDETLYFYGDDESYLYRRGEIRVPECVAITLTTKKPEGGSLTMKRLVMELMTTTLVSEPSGEEDGTNFLSLVDVLIRNCPSVLPVSTGMDALNFIYHKLH